ncbi:MAG: 3'-5' exonuclease [Bacteroidales bacterium]|nr:3'-5' exonuclease [Bacteroidales bacterium]
MNLNLKRPIAFFDLESTGLNIAHDNIIEICILKINPDQTEETLTARVKPLVPISKEAQEITGITMEDLKDCPTFKELAPKLNKFLENCDLGGFNSNKFDIPLLAEEFLKAGVDFDMTKRKRIDVQVIYHKMEQRNLTAAYKFYCGKNLDDAHSALADTRATYEVLKSQLDMYKDDIENNVDFLSNFSSHTSNVDFAGRMIYNEQGKEVFNFGKHKGRTVEEVLGKVDPMYYDWMMKNDFALNTKQALTQIKLRMAQERMNGGR